MFIDTFVAALLSVSAPDAGQAPIAAPPPPAAVAKPSAPARVPPPAAAPAVPAPATPMAADVQKLVDRMQRFYEKTEDFRAGFQQDYSYKASRRRQTSTGQVTFKKPGLMRWDYEKPGKKTFVLAGEKIYAYDPDAMTLSIAKIDTSQLSASVTFLFGRGRLANEFSIRKADCATCKGTLLILDPLKQDPRFKQLKLEVDPVSAQVLRSTVIDPDGSENAIAFLNLKRNTGVAADAFKINPPQGTRIDDYTKPRK